MTARSVGVVGTGLIGGSIAAGLRDAGWGVVGYDPDPDVGVLAAELGLVDRLLVGAAGRSVRIEHRLHVCDRLP